MHDVADLAGRCVEQQRQWRRRGGVELVVDLLGHEQQLVEPRQQFQQLVVELVEQHGVVEQQLIVEQLIVEQLIVDQQLQLVVEQLEFHRLLELQQLVEQPVIELVELLGVVLVVLAIVGQRIVAALTPVRRLAPRLVRQLQ